MKILFINPIHIGEKGGGEIVVLIQLNICKKIGKVTYFGRPFRSKKDKDGLERIIEVKVSKRKSIKALFKRYSSSIIVDWIDFRNEIKIKEYDFAYIQFSYLDMIVEDLKKLKIPTIVKVHNIEYNLNNLLINKNKHNFVKNIFQKRKIKAEKSVIDKSDICLVFSKEEKEDLISIYNIDEEKVKIRCMSLFRQEYHYKPNNNILITGSLWYKPNVDGIVWFIENVWRHLPVSSKQINLSIAGSRAQKKLKKVLHKYKGIKLYEDVEDMSLLFSKAGIYIAPIFWGAGVKVKICEALSYGLPIILTKHANIGYNLMNKEEAIITDSAEEMRQSIIELLENDDKKAKISKSAFEKFDKKHSFHYDLMSFKSLLTDLNI
ncbi:glycosyltransferase [bacterium]|nr:MAG: glycosyltransferase [bacterium]